jgi:hypothetical protein
MSTIEPPQLVVVESREALYRLIEDTAVEVQFQSQAAEQAYEKADWRLHLQICEVMGVTDSPERSDGLVYMIEDWWPNQTKIFQADATAFGPDQVKALRALLQGEFEDWRINVTVFRDFNGDKPECIGGLTIYATRTLVQREALGVVERSSPNLGALRRGP